MWQDGTDSRAALPWSPSGGQPEEPGGEGLVAKVGSEVARPAAVEGSEFGSSWSWRRLGRAVGGSERLHGWLQPPAGWERVAGRRGERMQSRGWGGGRGGQQAPMIPQIVPE